MSFVPHYVSRITVAVSSSLALAVAFLGLSQFDLPVVRYIRSVTAQIPSQKLIMPWMAFTSDAGNWIGEGTHLVVFSLILAVAGWVFSQSTVMKSGIDTLLAHGLAALVVNGLKHLIGRPRPKFAHSGEWQIAPSFVSGFDSFPSGHTAVSFAVATVLAKRFPLIGPLCLGIAVFVMFSRIFRGSHFPTDVMGGAVFGALSGTIAAAPLKQWRASLLEGLLHTAIGASAGLALLWTVSRPAEEGTPGILLIALGLASTMSGLWVRRVEWVKRQASDAGLPAKASMILIAYGLASMTTSFYVVAAAGFSCLAYWVNGALVSVEAKPCPETWPAVKEGLLLAMVLLSLLILYAGRGIMSFR
ncbi:MAG: phosphatase PAP2 family protein [Nitrospira sp.]|nr:phosphatase PAP2 family protein [Nitrospira sp.]